MKERVKEWMNPLFTHYLKITKAGHMKKQKKKQWGRFYARDVKVVSTHLKSETLK